MVTRGKKFRTIDYTARDFESIKRELQDYKRRYYSDISKDESEAAFDDIVLDTVSYVGDILSFYTDYAANESFLETAVEYNNVLKHARQLGYKFRGSPSSIGQCSFYILVPANSTGLGPDRRYLPILKRGSEFASVTGNGFILNEDVNFANSNNETVVARVDQTTGVPTFFAVKANGQVISGRIIEEILEIGSFQRLLRVQLSNPNISEVLSVTDDEGHEYYEVENLSQDTVYRAVTNRDSNTSEQTPSLLKPFIVPRRYVVERERQTTFLQFGYGSERDQTSDPLVDPSQVVLELFGKDFIGDTSIDPTKLLGTDKLGIAPSNTELRVVYRTNTSENVNARARTVTEVVNPILEYSDPTVLDFELIRSTNESLEVTNESSIVGSVSLPDVSELKRRVFGAFGAQKRAVTAVDLRSLVYSMHPRFGAVKRVNVVPDPESFKRNLNMYILSEDSDGTFTTANSALKQNVRQWILRHKMVNDTIDILDAKIVNIGIDFTAVGELDTNKFEIKERAIRALQREFRKKLDIGENFFITRIYNVLRDVEGIVDVTRVEVFQKNGGSYSDTRFDLNDALSQDGRFYHVPQNVVMEIKFPSRDIRGSVL